MRKRGHFVVRGRVQGVCYRMYACDEAARLGVRGWVRNRPDGTVEVVAEAEEGVLASFLTWCRQGPPHAAVGEVSESYSPATGEFGTFTVAF
jgi:acylphosphatase